MPDAGSGTLIMQRSYGTVPSLETAALCVNMQRCRKPWFVSRLRSAPRISAPLGSPSYKHPPVTAAPM